MIEGRRRMPGAGDRPHRRCGTASPELSWRRAGARWSRQSSRVLSPPAGAPRPGVDVPDTRRYRCVRPASSSTS